MSASELTRIYQTHCLSSSHPGWHIWGPFQVPRRAAFLWAKLITTEAPVKTQLPPYRAAQFGVQPRGLRWAGTGCRSTPQESGSGNVRAPQAVTMETAPSGWCLETAPLQRAGTEACLPQAGQAMGAGKCNGATGGFRTQKPQGPGVRGKLNLKLLPFPSQAISFET